MAARGGRPTLEAVARRAGVGRGTVSRVVNGSSRVSPRARAAVLRAIDELGYVPNHAARALVTQRTDTVALVVSETGERLFDDPFYSRVVRGISAGLAGTGLQLSLMMARSPEEYTHLERYLTGRHVDGVLLLALHGDDPLPRLLDEAGLPYVLGGRPITGDPPAHLSFVDNDNVDGARQAVGHLVGRGRRRIATVTGPLDMAGGVQRLAGYREGLAAAGLPVDERMIVEGDFTADGGAAAMRRLLDAGCDIDAVFVASDAMALGALRVLKERGLAVPADVALVGFDDAEVAQHTDPPLTTVRQDNEAMGLEMARVLLARLRDDSAGPAQVILATELVVRESA